LLHSLARSEKFGTDTRVEELDMTTQEAPNGIINPEWA